MGNYKLIKEFTPDLLTESVLDESTGLKKWSISSVTLQSEVKNKNGRKYPKKILSEAIDKHVKEFLTSERALGELNHPDTEITTINLDRVSHKFTEVTEDGNDYITKANILDTPCGKIVQNLLAGDVKLGISSRGLGKVNHKSGEGIVENLYLVSLGDIVSNPSAPNAFVNGVLESVEFEFINNGFSRVEISEELDKYNKLIKNSSRNDINLAVKHIFDDFIKKLK